MHVCARACVLSRVRPVCPVRTAPPETSRVQRSPRQPGAGAGGAHAGASSPSRPGAVLRKAHAEKRGTLDVRTHAQTQTELGCVTELALSWLRGGNTGPSSRCPHLGACGGRSGVCSAERKPRPPPCTVTPGGEAAATTLSRLSVQSGLLLLAVTWKQTCIPPSAHWPSAREHLNSQLSGTQGGDVMCAEPPEWHREMSSSPPRTGEHGSSGEPPCARSWPAGPPTPEPRPGSPLTFPSCAGRPWAHGPRRGWRTRPGLAGTCWFWVEPAGVEPGLLPRPPLNNRGVRKRDESFLAGRPLYQNF